MFKKLYFKFELLRAYLRKNIGFLFLGLILGSAASYFGPSVIKIINAQRLQTEVIGVNGLYTVNKLPPEIANLISFGLTISQDNGKTIISPLVKSWQLDSTNTVYTFNLNDYYWQSGKKFTAYDVNYNFTGSKIQVTSDNVLKITTEKPFSPLLSLVDKPLLKKDLTGLGPFMVTDVTYQDSYIKSLYLKSRVKGIPDKAFHFYPSEKELISAYKMGKIDIIDQIDDPQDLENWPKTEITPDLNYNRYIALFINTSKIKDKKLRQALAYATPKPVDKKDEYGFHRET
ncbi:ABC transporter substrate-binding protein, partial [Patescibacteria group bacterium]|nr:ABC transporter substrate-binding protein [Patescibacteria group bacterium]